MIAVIVPAHNEEDHIGACLHSLTVASACPDLMGEAVLLIVVLDDCSDGTQGIAAALGARTVDCQARNVGTARAIGAHLALAAGARWLAFTDADSEVAPNWIAQQLCQQADAVCGTVQVRDWGTHGDAVRAQFDALYQDRDGHRHIHGANLGLTAQAYSEVGGFEPLATGEDVALVHRLQERGLSIAWTSATRVTTSARKQFRAPAGFGATLLQLGTTLTALPALLG
ncbi:glycosyl transferase [Acidovorax sp. CF316]|uniref:glycosyltransferase n=1 Tax=Acidovorax sp. CF316 TaxID=1144317 RepID=UPI00026BE531|nr:glycosyltransferase [Acidovorax sp. CF316]EJE50985.1 glycosyl transferase [Acidovorax sp. CF316]